MVSPGLIGDIGATNARFALVEEAGRFTRPRVFLTDEHAGLGDAVSTYLADERPSSRPVRAVLAVASPITGDNVVLTNNPWHFSITALQKELGLERLEVVNDFVACALAVPHMTEADRLQIGHGAPSLGKPIGLLGPGTGLGVSALIPTKMGPVVIESEGGHVTLPAENVREEAVLGVMRRRFDHVSAERVLSGPGLVNLYNALCELSGAPAASFTAPQITDPRIDQEDTRAKEARDMFFAMLGSVAGNLALTFGARGGIFIAGGIAPKLADCIARSNFRNRFELKGRFRSYLAEIPTYIVQHPWPALLGASQLLNRGSSSHSL